jgi:PhnB protein
LEQTKATRQDVKPIPEGYHTLTPVLVLDDAASAIDFYKRAFGARDLGSMLYPDGKRIMHAELQIGDSRLMLSDEFPEWGGARAPKSLGGITGSLHLYVPDADAAFKRAVEAGATVTMPLADALWGDRYGVVTDPFGLQWSFGTHQEEVSEEEMQRRMQTQMAGQPT